MALSPEQEKEDLWKSLRKKFEEKQRQDQLPQCGRCKRKGHTAGACTVPRRPTDKE